MNKIRDIRLKLALAFAVAAFIVFLASMLGTQSKSRTESAAENLGAKVEKRLNILEGYMQKALEGSPQEWLDLSGIQEDMVVYRYYEDTLQSWINQFPLRNDDIRPLTLVQRLGDSRSNYASPLSNVTDTWTYVNHGPKWYLEKMVQQGDCKVIAGLQIVDELSAGSLNGVNRRLGVDRRLSIHPLSGSAGVPVTVGGTSVFKLADESLAEPSQRHSAFIWLALALALAALLMLLLARPTLFCAGIVALAQMGLLLWLYIYGHALGQASQIFSPLLYADGSLLYSLGAVILINIAIGLLVLDAYIVRWTVLKAVRRIGSRILEALMAFLCLAAAVGICIYMHLAFKSVLVNSSITLELYKVTLLSTYTGLVYASFLALALTVPVLLQLMSPHIRLLIGLRYDMFSVPARVIYAAAAGVYFVVASSTLGFHKEQQRVQVWANRLAMDRDIGLEIQLRSAENAIQADAVIGALSVLDGSTDLIRSRLISSYMGRISQDYDIAVMTGKDGSAASLFQDRIRGGVQLGEASHFFYNTIGSGRAAYTGIFTYYVRDAGASSILVTVESKHNREDRGYLSLLGIADPGRVSLPPVYSWAKYSEDRLVQYKGAYPYPTAISGRLKDAVGHLDMEGWCHFVHNVSETERIVISRKSTEWLYYVVEGFLLSILAFLSLSLLCLRRRRSFSGRRYYQARIGLVVYVSLILTLVAMAGFSVWFVYKRNNADMQSIMTARINTLQSMLQEHLRQVEGPDGIRSAEVIQAVEAVGNNLRCDITLFDTGGSVVMSTTPEVYDRMILGHRLNDDAYRNIRYSYKRIYMHPERVGRRRYWALYAPIMNSNARMVGIVSSPFTDLTHDMESEAVLHIATVITIFLLLLMISRFITFEVVAGLFRPITELRRKMTVTDVDHLEPLEYDQDDEITPLVQAYNRMVKDLGDSSRRLAQVERDKAWTDMARRVAHDLKNPLTPIKLQLQMLMRMKATGNPQWQERFDEVAQTVLYHVDLLADSADQFSTFAKMYDQKSERLDLDALVQQEVSLFDSRDDVSLEYFGLPGSFVKAPRPQLTRVVVNLLTNAIQAIEGMEGEKRMLVSVRNSVEDGFYEIVVEDNGPGVSEQNQDKIFTPDFTTKTSGSGLGLAICRRIAEHCGGSISYSRSFSLGGACFTVKYPKE